MTKVNKDIPKYDYILSSPPAKIYAYGEEQEPVTWAAYINKDQELIYVSDTVSHLPLNWVKIGRVYFDDPDIAAPMQMHVCQDTLRRKYPYIPFISNTKEDL